jgi:hypothetical protein
MDISNFVLLQHSHDQEIIDLCKENHYFQRNDMVPCILNVSWNLKATNNVGVCLKNDDNHIVGFIGALDYTWEGKTIVNLSCGIIDSSLRGKGYASSFFRYAFSLGDVILDLSPTAQVHAMLLKHISGLKQNTDYQLWIRPKRKKTRLFSSIDKNDVLACLPDWFAKVYDDNAKYQVHFIKISDGENDCVFAYYTFSRYCVKGFEIIYCSHKAFFERYFSGVISEINKTEHAFVCFCDHLFCPNKSFSGNISKFGTTGGTYAKRLLRLMISRKGYIKTANRRLYWSKTADDFDFPLGYLYTEVVFYKSTIH